MSYLEVRPIARRGMRGLGDFSASLYPDQAGGGPYNVGGNFYIFVVGAQPGETVNVSGTGLVDGPYTADYLGKVSIQNTVPPMWAASPIVAKISASGGTVSLPIKVFGQPAAASPVSAPLGPVLGIRLLNLTTGDNTVFHVGDQYKMMISGGPSYGLFTLQVTQNGWPVQPVYQSGGIAGTGDQFDYNGNITYSGTFTDGQRGDWVETVLIAGRPAATIKYSVIPASTVPMTLAQLQAAQYQASQVAAGADVAAQFNAWAPTIGTAQPVPVATTGMYAPQNAYNAPNNFANSLTALNALIAGSPEGTYFPPDVLARVNAATLATPVPSPVIAQIPTPGSPVLPAVSPTSTAGTSAPPAVSQIPVIPLASVVPQVAAVPAAADAAVSTDFLSSSVAGIPMWGILAGGVLAVVMLVKK